MTRAIAVIDGEHHPDAVRAALAARDVHAAVFCGGEEKLAPEVLEDPQRWYGVPVLLGDPAAALRELAPGADVVVDLADEPVLDPPARFRLAGVALDLGLRWQGADFELRPPDAAPLPFAGPALAVIGTGKRTGKTALGTHWARLLNEAGARPVIVAMGRGGPPEPELAEPGVALERLLELSRSGRHAASDFLEDAALAGVPAVGCRRVGGGLAGGCVESTVAAGARLAVEQAPGVLLFEGSGATIPPVAVHRTVCVVGSRAGALEHLGPYRLLRAQLAVVTADDPDLARDVAGWGPAAIRARLVAEPAEPLAAGARVAFFTTGAGDPPAGVEPVVLSRNLARRAALRDDLAAAEARRCDTYLCELKAAAVDTVAEAAQRTGARVVWVRNRPVALEGEPDLDAALLGLYKEALELAAA